MSQYLVRQVEATPNIDVRLETEVIDGGGTARLEHLALRDNRNGRVETVTAEPRFLMIGARPHTDWLPAAVARDEQGFVLAGRTSRLGQAGGVSRGRGIGDDPAAPPAARTRRRRPNSVDHRAPRRMTASPVPG